MSHSSLPITSKLFQLTFLTCALALAGCGGGDGTDVIAPTPDLGGGEGQQQVESLNITSSSLIDADGNAITSVNLEGAYYEVMVTDKSNKPVANAKVVFSIDAEGVDLSQTTSGSKLTDSEGKARIFLKPNAPEVSGGYTITATANDNNSNVAVNNLTFAVQATGVSLSNLQVTDSQLSAGGQTAISLTATDSAGAPISGILVSLNANCGQLPAQATSDENGMITFVYKAINIDNTLCSGNVRISATTGNSPTQTANITVQAPEATSIIYTSNELTLGIQNSGSSSTGEAEFTIYSNKTPLANAKVILSLEKSPLGATFGVLGNKSNFNAVTDANGKVSVNIYPGSTPGPVEIKATLASDTRINALSKGISIASSRVTQDGISLSFGVNVLDWSFDGDTTPVTARLVDRNGNAVPNGTVVNFTTEGGKVSPSSCTTTNGECEVEFSTQNPRSGDGRVSLLAVAEGEKAYIDMNENNAWDEGIDTLVHNIGDTFRDDNENGTFEIGEFTYPLTTQANQTCENNVKKFIQLKFPSSSEEVKAAFESQYISNFVSPNKPMTCNSSLDAIVRYERIQLISDGNSATFTLLDNSNTPLQPQKISATDIQVNIRINSGGFYDLNPMPSGSTIAATVVDKTDKNDKSCTIELRKGLEIVPDIVVAGSPGENTGTITTYSIDQCATNDLVKISVTSPKGNTFSRVYDIK